MRTTLAALAALGSWSLAACSNGHLPGVPAAEEGDVPSARGDAGARGANKPLTATASLARGVSLQEVALFQGTRVALAQAGKHATERRMHVVAGRDALVRAYAVPERATGVAITGDLYVVKDDKVLASFRDTVSMNGPSTEEDPATTFDFNVPGQYIAEDTSFFVRLLEEGAPEVSATAPSPAQYPMNGVPESFGAERSTDKLRVVIVPVRYLADGSGRMPEISNAVVDAIRMRMLEFYPVPDVEVTVRQAIDWNRPIMGSGVGWDEILQRVTRARLEDNAAPDVYYYGAFAAAPTLSSFCSGECVLGLSNFGDDAIDSAQRASVGALYATNKAIDTVPHEIGHAHGREHAPCGPVASSDPTYPYGGAIIGTWGYSVVTKSLKRPSLYDQMSYCAPSWQSDYTYRALFDRVRTVASLRGPTGALAGGAQGGDAPPEGRLYRMLTVDANGGLAWSGEPFRTSLPLRGVPQRVSFVGERGDAIGETIAHAYRYSHLAGGTLIVPWEDAHARKARAMRIDADDASAPAFIARARVRFGGRPTAPLD